MFTDESIRGMFNALDKDNSGKIDKEDLAKVLPFPKSTIDMVVKFFDKTGDGKLEYWEFKNVMEKLKKK